MVSGRVIFARMPHSLGAMHSRRMFPRRLDDFTKRTTGEVGKAASSRRKSSICRWKI
jgi:hypothetical protein